MNILSLRSLQRSLPRRGKKKIQKKKKVIMVRRAFGARVDDDNNDLHPGLSWPGSPPASNIAPAHWLGDRRSTLYFVLP